MKRESPIPPPPPVPRALPRTKDSSEGIVSDKSIRGGANSFWWITGITLLDVATILAGGTRGPWYGLGVTHFTVELTGINKPLLLGVAGCAAIFFLLAGFGARRGSQKAFIVGGVVYLLDALLLLYLKEFWAVGFHALFLVSIVGSLVFLSITSPTIYAREMRPPPSSHIDPVVWKIALNLDAALELILKKEHAYALVNEADFSHLNLEFYRQVQGQIEQCGFRYLNDIENLAVSQTYQAFYDRMMCRVLVSDDGIVVATVYHIRLKNWINRIVDAIVNKGGFKVVQFATRFSDDDFILTSNKKVRGLNTTIPAFETETIPGASIEQLYARHRERIVIRMQNGAETQATPVKVFSIQDVFDAFDLERKLWADYRLKQGGYSMEEAQLVFPKRAVQLHAALEMLWQQRIADFSEHSYVSPLPPVPSLDTNCGSD